MEDSSQDHIYQFLTIFFHEYIYNSNFLKYAETFDIYHQKFIGNIYVYFLNSKEIRIIE